MILSKGMPAEAAAQQVKSLLGFARDEPIDGSPYPPAHFRLWLGEARETREPV